jgi:hypothetical protein
MDAIFQTDPSGAVLAFADMLQKQIVMPAHLMDDGRHSTLNDGRNLFKDFSGGLLTKASKRSQRTGYVCELGWQALARKHGIQATQLSTPRCAGCPVLSWCAAVAEGAGVYTAQDYCSIAEHLIGR